jgi:hypothetical protein
MRQFGGRWRQACAGVMVAAVCLFAGCAPQMQRMLNVEIGPNTPDEDEAAQTAAVQEPVRPAAPARPVFQICDGCVLVDQDGRALFDAANSVQGVLENIIVSGEMVQFIGWAADVQYDRSVKGILIFADNVLVHSAAAVDQRYDVSRDLKLGGLARFGFSAVLPKTMFVGPNGKERKIRVFAVSEVYTVKELRLVIKK